MPQVIGFGLNKFLSAGTNLTSLPSKRHSTSHHTFLRHIGAQNGSQKVCQGKRWFGNPLHHPLRQGHCKTFGAISWFHEATLKRRSYISWCRNQYESNIIKPRNLRVFTTNEVPWGAAPSARLYTYGQVTGVHRPRWGPDQRRRCRRQNLQQWAEGTRGKISHWKKNMKRGNHSMSYLVWKDWNHQHPPTTCWVSMPRLKP